jgi:hypothetical protein
LTVRIRKDKDGLYSAEVFDLPPNLPWVKPEWMTPVAMGAHDLCRELLARGFHPTDIGDAFYEADPDWLTTGSGQG